MRNKSPATISAILTVLILVLLSILFLLLQMIALNGASERQGLDCHGNLAWLSKSRHHPACDACRPSDHISDHEGRVEQPPGSCCHRDRRGNNWRSYLLSNQYCCYPGGGNWMNEKRSCHGNAPYSGMLSNLRAGLAIPS